VQRFHSLGISVFTRPRSKAVIASVTGTETDPQDYSRPV
jgi:hypothetical protein